MNTIHPLALRMLAISTFINQYRGVNYPQFLHCPPLPPKRKQKGRSGKVNQLNLVEKFDLGNVVSFRCVCVTKFGIHEIKVDLY